MLGAGNPGGVCQAWIKNTFIDGFRPDVMYKIPVAGSGEGKREYITQCFIPSRLEDNPSLLEKDPGYRTRLLALPEHLRRALYDGDWDIYAGQVFDEWRREAHVRKPFALPPTVWFKFYSMDWGYNKPYAVSKMAVNGDGKVIKYGEIYGCKEGEVNKGTRESSAEVADKAWQSAVNEGVVDMVADPAAWNKQDNYPAPAESFSARGFRMCRANNDRVPGLMNFHNYLKETDQNGLPMFQVFETCYHTIRTIPALLPDRNRPEDVDSGLEDHIYDADRYALMSDFVSHSASTLRRQHAQGAAVRKKYDVP
jgi:hypothetical protein